MMKNFQDSNFSPHGSGMKQKLYLLNLCYVKLIKSTKIIFRAGNSKQCQWESESECWIINYQMLDPICDQYVKLESEKCFAFFI